MLLGDLGGSKEIMGVIKKKIDITPFKPDLATGQFDFARLR
jgi:hypothetical protein